MRIVIFRYTSSDWWLPKTIILRHLTKHPQLLQLISAIDWHHSSRMLAVGDLEGGLAILHRGSRAAVASYKPYQQGSVLCISWNSHSKGLAWTTRDSSVYFVHGSQIDTAKETKSYDLYPQRVQLSCLPSLMMIWLSGTELICAGLTPPILLTQGADCLWTEHRQSDKYIDDQNQDAHYSQPTQSSHHAQLFNSALSEVSGMHIFGNVLLSATIYGGVSLIAWEKLRSPIVLSSVTT